MYENNAWDLNGSHVNVLPFWPRSSSSSIHFPSNAASPWHLISDHLLTCPEGLATFTGSDNFCLLPGEG